MDEEELQRYNEELQRWYDDRQQETDEYIIDWIFPGLLLGEEDE